MKRSRLLRHLRRHGCFLKREGRAHSLWTNPNTGAVEAVPRHSEMLTGPRVVRTGGLVKPFGIHTTTLRFGDRTANGSTRRMFADAWCRYVPRSVEPWNMATHDGDEPDL